MNNMVFLVNLVIGQKSHSFILMVKESIIKIQISSYCQSINNRKFYSATSSYVLTDCLMCIRELSTVKAEGGGAG